MPAHSKRGGRLHREQVLRGAPTAGLLLSTGCGHHLGLRLAVSCVLWLAQVSRCQVPSSCQRAGGRVRSYGGSLLLSQGHLRCGGLFGLFCKLTESDIPATLAWSDTITSLKPSSLLFDRSQTARGLDEGVAFRDLAGGQSARVRSDNTAFRVGLSAELLLSFH